MAEAAVAALPGIWPALGAQRAEFSQAVLCGPRGGVVLARDMADAIAFVDDYAPEHLEVLSDEPFAYLGRIEHAGEILLGPHTLIVLGNFVLGAYPELAHHARILATYEGFAGHAHAISPARDEP